MKKPAQKVAAGDLLARLQANPDYIAAQEKQRNELQIRSERSHQEQTLLLTELRETGCRIDSVWDLVNTCDYYDAVIPILLKHLKLPYSGLFAAGSRGLWRCPRRARQGTSFLVNTSKSLLLVRGPG